jgi:hypothetical protein
VTGLRVVDASTLPFQVSSHLMSVLYGLVRFFLAMRRRAADLIKADHPAGNVTTGVEIHPNSDTSKCLEVQSTSYSNGVLVERVHKQNTRIPIADCVAASMTATAEQTSSGRSPEAPLPFGLPGPTTVSTPVRALPTAYR